MCVHEGFVVDSGVNIDGFVCVEGEFRIIDEAASRIKNGDTFIINIVATGIALVGEELFKYLKKLCREAIERYGLKKMSFRWVQTKDIRNT